MFYKTPKTSESGKKIAEYLKDKKARRAQLRAIQDKVGARAIFVDYGGNFFCFQFEGEPDKRKYKFDKRAYAQEWRDGVKVEFYKAWPRLNTREGKEVQKMIDEVPKSCCLNTDANKLFGWDGIIAKRGIDEHHGWFVFKETEDVYLINHHRCDKGYRPVMPSDVIEITETEYDSIN